MNLEEGLNGVEDFGNYSDNVVESEQVEHDAKAKMKSKFNQEKSFVQDIQ